MIRGEFPLGARSGRFEFRRLTKDQAGGGSRNDGAGSHKLQAHVSVPITV